MVMVARRGVLGLWFFFLDIKGWNTSIISRLHSRKLTWQPQKGPIKTTGLLEGDYMSLHVSLGESNTKSETPNPKP